MIGAPSSLSIPAAATPVSAAPVQPRLRLSAGLLATLPVFIQAPWVRSSPFSAALFTAVLIAVGLLLARHGDNDRRQLGSLLVGFSGCWLGGGLFWGWFRLHPVCHLPIEAFALPLAIGGLATGGRWRLAASFYLASLLGTACTDAAIASLGLMDLWTTVLAAPSALAPQLLHQAAIAICQPQALLTLGCFATALLLLCRQLDRQGPCGRVAAATLATTLAVDGLFVQAALLAPRLSGLI